jgi:hypothetical protein
VRPSTLAWLDHDSSAQDRAKRILALFQEKGTQDQLGLGGVRDSFADLFFPGTSTIQTRLRYFLFIPWMYRRLEAEEVPSNRIAQVARERELALIEPLLSEDEEGVFGRTARGDLKRLPSEVYWGGLVSWGIRRFDASRAQYHRAMDELYRQRRQARTARSREDGETRGEITWHPELPPPPESFPERATLDVTLQEAEFIRDRIVAEHPDSLLAWLALHPGRTDVRFPWEHPRLSSMKPDHRRMLEHARIFSLVMEGAPILYNHLVSEELGHEGWIDAYRTMHGDWVARLDPEEVESWSLDELFAVVRRERSHTVTPHAQEFIRRWVALVRNDALGVPSDPVARRLIRQREIRLKRAHSLFRNRRAREERYRGGLGLGRLSFRWTDVQTLLNDLHDGLEGG